MPSVIKRGTANKALYSYYADGSKSRVIDASGTGYDYMGSFKYARKGNTLTLESAAASGGRIHKTAKGYEVRYHIADHLGSVRLVTSASGTILEQNDYHPYGTRHARAAHATTPNPYLYGGKELQQDFGVNYYDSHARFQTNSGIFLSIDPLSVQMPGVSPYAYCSGNPIKFIDADGKKIFFSQAVSESYKEQFALTIRYMNERGTSNDIAALHKSETIYFIEDGNAGFDPNSNTISWSPKQIVKTDKNILLFPSTILAHEAKHGRQKEEMTSEEFDKKREIDQNNPYTSKLEEEVITTTEQIAAKKHGDIKDGEITRDNHHGQIIQFNKPLPDGKILEDYKTNIKRRIYELD